MTTMLPTQTFQFRYPHPDAILKDPETINQALQSYLHTTMPHGSAFFSEDHPTPEGLALALGFPGYAAMFGALQKLIDKTPKDQPIPSVVSLIGAACATLQDYYLKHTLHRKLPESMVRFIASAYFNINATQSVNTNATINDNKTVTIKIETTQPNSIEEATEIARLTRALALQTTTELASLNKTERRPIQTPHREVSIEDII